MATRASQIKEIEMNLFDRRLLCCHYGTHICLRIRERPSQRNLSESALKISKYWSSNHGDTLFTEGCIYCITLVVMTNMSPSHLDRLYSGRVSRRNQQIRFFNRIRNRWTDVQLPPPGEIRPMWLPPVQNRGFGNGLPTLDPQRNIFADPSSSNRLTPENLKRINLSDIIRVHSRTICLWNKVNTQVQRKTILPPLFIISFNCESIIQEYIVAPQALSLYP